MPISNDDLKKAMRLQAENHSAPARLRRLILEIPQTASPRRKNYQAANQNQILSRQAKWQVGGIAASFFVTIFTFNIFAATTATSDAEFVLGFVAPEVADQIVAIAPTYNPFNETPQ